MLRNLGFMNIAVYNTPMRRSHCFVLDNFCSSCQILTLSKPKRTVTPYMYICLFNLCHRSFRHGYRFHKGKTFTLKTTSSG